MSDNNCWFPAKRYGWGWGLPTRWQGWLVLLAFAGLIMAGVVLLLPRVGETVFAVYFALIFALLLGVCQAKGEPPRWRWGGK
jgi:hypothetical protein